MPAEAFAFIEQLDRLSTAAQVMDAMERALGRFGFDRMLIGRLPEQHFEQTILATSWPAQHCQADRRRACANGVPQARRGQSHARRRHRDARTHHRPRLKTRFLATVTIERGDAPNGTPSVCRRLVRAPACPLFFRYGLFVFPPPIEITVSIHTLSVRIMSNPR
jgi:hypothetical protein